RLQTILSSSQALERVYSARLILQEVWSRTHQSKQDMLRALGDWCKEAEASGIKALEDFSAMIRSYALNPQMTAMAR
ncbi:MAG TPA: transposase, partial [Pseudomonadales bacterium]|nr:transposase [Pseudomonadales bacterium]